MEIIHSFYTFILTLLCLIVPLTSYIRQYVLPRATKKKASQIAVVREYSTIDTVLGNECEPCVRQVAGVTRWTVRLTPD